MAKLFVVAYDLIDDESDAHYQRVIGAIKQQGDAEEIQRSVWMLKSDKEKGAIRDAVGNELDSSDKLFVGRLKGFASLRLSQRASDLADAAWH